MPLAFENLWRRAVLACAGLIAFGAAQAASVLEEKLVIVTSFPEYLTGVFQTAFEKKYPQTKVEVLNKETSARVICLQETAGKNTTDLFWVSAPDAFAVLKAKWLLQPYQPQSSAIPVKPAIYANAPRDCPTSSKTTPSERPSSSTRTSPRVATIR